MGAWLSEGARTALLRAPDWRSLHPGPALVAVLVLATVLLNLALDRLFINGPAQFQWQAMASGWLGTAVLAWACYLVRPYRGDNGVGPAHLLCLVLAQSLILTAVLGALYVGLFRIGWYSQRTLGETGVWVLWLAPAVWTTLAQIVLLARASMRGPGLILFAALCLAGSTALYFAERPANFWLPAGGEEGDESRRQLSLTQDVLEAQPQVLAQALDGIQPQRPGVVDLYALTFAPYSDEDVFLRESAMVAGVMAKRFDAEGRTVQLVNHAQTVKTLPWATPKNLQRAIQRMAAQMDRDEDVLFLHLTSHGARNGELAAEFWPLHVDPVSPSALRAWLDAAGIRHRVISISACYSGSWIEPLSDDNTLVMTAADATHTSYGCGRGSELTFFGRAMYDEQLRTSTLSFEAAHAAAREVIRKREEEAGKDDGYSNPQIRAGAGIRERLAALQKRLAAPN